MLRLRHLIVILLLWFSSATAAYDTDDHYYMDNFTRNAAGLVVSRHTLEQTLAANGYENSFLKRDYDYNSLGLVSKETYYTSSKYSPAYTIKYNYDGVGNLTKKTLGSSIWEYTYDDKKRLRRETLPSGEVHRYDYDVFGQVTNVVLGPLEYEYQYDAFGQLIKEVSPSRGTINNTYHLSGLPKKTTNNDGSWVNREYDGEGRLVRIQYSSETDKTVLVYYAESGLLKSASGRSNGQQFVKHYTYDALGRLTTEATTIGDRTGTMSYSYAAHENVIESITYPSGRRVEYSYEHPVLRVATKVKIIDGNHTQTVVSDVEYGNNGVMQGYTMRSGHRYSTNMNLSTLMADQHIANKLDVDYTVDSQGQMSRVDDNRSSSRTRRFDYSQDLALSKVKTSSGAVRDSVSYSSNGDIHSIDGTLFTYDSNRRLKGVGSRDFEYNSRGNMSHWESVSGSLTTIGYDARGLSSHFVKGGVQHYFDRDHQGVLLSHRQGSERDHYYFQGAQLLSERDGSSAQFKDYIYLNSQLIGVYDDSDGLNNVITGHLGQPVAMFNASGTLVWRGVVDGYDIAVEVESTPLKMRFPGQYAILGNGLYYNYHRDYDPSIGRYLQSDPIGLAGGLNTYAYVGGNPVNFVDPLGLARRQERPLDIPGLRNTTVGPLQHDRFQYDNGSDSGYYGDGDGTVRPDNAPQSLLNQYQDVGRWFDDNALQQAEQNVQNNGWFNDPYNLNPANSHQCQDYADEVEREYDRITDRWVDTRRGRRERSGWRQQWWRP